MTFILNNNNNNNNIAFMHHPSPAIKKSSPTIHQSILMTGRHDIMWKPEDNRKQNRIQLYALVNLKQLIIKDCTQGTILLKLNTDRNEASCSLSETAERLVKYTTACLIRLLFQLLF